MTHKAHDTSCSCYAYLDILIVIAGVGTAILGAFIAEQHQWAGGGLLLAGVVIFIIALENYGRCPSRQ